MRAGRRERDRQDCRRPTSKCPPGRSVRRHELLPHSLSASVCFSVCAWLPSSVVSIWGAGRAFWRQIADGGSRIAAGESRLRAESRASNWVSQSPETRRRKPAIRHCGKPTGQACQAAQGRAAAHPSPPPSSTARPP